MKGIYNHPNLLINRLSQDFRQLIHFPLIFQDMNSNVKEHKKEFTTVPYLINQRNPSKDWFNTLLNVLEENQPRSNGKQMFIKHCRELFVNEPATLRIILNKLYNGILVKVLFIDFLMRHFVNKIKT